MKIIEKLSQMIADELDGAEEYIKEAIAQKDTDNHLASTFFDISMQEMNHVNLLHAEVARLIEEYRKTNGEPPEGMLALYNYLHKQHIDRAGKIKAMQQMYRET